MVDPWGRVCLDMGGTPGQQTVTLDLEQVDKARASVPSWREDMRYTVDSSHGDPNL